MSLRELIALPSNASYKLIEAWPIQFVARPYPVKGRSAATCTILLRSDLGGEDLDTSAGSDDCSARVNTICN